jgi:dynactin complex subunit
LQRGATNTDDNGEFEVSFTPKKRDSQDMSRSIYSFILTANVTDVNGETQVGRYVVNVGDVSMVLQVEMQSKFNKKSDDKIVIRAKNLDGNDIDAKGNYKLYTLQHDDSIGQQLRLRRVCGR